MAGAHAVLFNTGGITAGNIQERDYTSTSSGSVSSTTSWTVASYSEDTGASTYTYTISRSNTASGLYQFDETASSLEFIAAMGSSTGYTYHGGDNRIYGTMYSDDVTGAPTAMTPAPTPASSKGQMKRFSVILLLGICVASIMTML